MTKPGNRVFDEFGKMMLDATSLFGTIREEVEIAVKSQIAKTLQSMDLVQRDDFEALKELVQKSHEKQQQLEAKIAELEKQSTRTAKNKADKAPKAGNSPKSK